MVEVSIATAVSMLGLFGVILVFFFTLQAEQQSRARADTAMAFRNVLATIKSQPFEKTVALFGEGSTRDVVYCGPEGEVSFDPLQVTTIVAKLEFFLDETAIPPEFGCFSGRADLNGDGRIDADISRPRILPLKITLQPLRSLGGEAKEFWILLGPDRDGEKR